MLRSLATLAGSASASISKVEAGRGATVERVSAPTPSRGHQCPMPTIEGWVQGGTQRNNRGRKAVSAGRSVSDGTVELWPSGAPTGGKLEASLITHSAVGKAFMHGLAGLHG